MRAALGGQGMLDDIALRWGRNWRMAHKGHRSRRTVAVVDTDTAWKSTGRKDDKLGQTSKYLDMDRPGWEVETVVCLHRGSLANSRHR